MLLKRILNVAAVGVLGLCVGVSCKKEVAAQSTPVSCRDGTCCGPAGTDYQYAETYENTLVTLASSGGWGINFGKPIPTGTKETWKTVAEVCNLSLDKIPKLSQEEASKGVQSRVWGRLYIGANIPTLTVGSPRFFAIDRIEVVK